MATQTCLRTARTLSRSSLRPLILRRTNSSLPEGVTKDPSHPNLFYHLNPSPPSAPESIILSFLPTSPTSSTYLGTLPAIEGAGLNDFRENPKFRPVLNEAIKDGLEKNVSYAIQYEAESRPTDGYITITDERNLPPQGRIGETEDLIASVFVEGGKVIASTYEPLPSYRLVTGYGVCTLPRGLDEHVVKWMQKVDEEAKE